jgi:hypothetical protein
MKTTQHSYLLLMLFTISVCFAFGKKIPYTLTVTTSPSGTLYTGLMNSAVLNTPLAKNQFFTTNNSCEIFQDDSIQYSIVTFGIKDVIISINTIKNKDTIVLQKFIFKSKKVHDPELFYGDNPFYINKILQPISKKKLKDCTNFKLKINADYKKLETAFHFDDNSYSAIINNKLIFNPKQYDTLFLINQHGMDSILLSSNPDYQKLDEKNLFTKVKKAVLAAPIGSTFILKDVRSNGTLGAYLINGLSTKIVE